MMLGQSTGRAALGRPVFAANLHRTGAHLVGVPDHCCHASPSHHHIDLTGCIAQPGSTAASRPSLRRGLMSPSAAVGNGVANGNGASTQYDYDLFTIGAGSGGVRGSRMAAQYGAKVAVAELPFDYNSSETKGGIGGTCVLRGCVPKKLMVYASEYAMHFHDSVGFGWEKRPMPKLDWGKFIAAKRKELQRLLGAYTNTLNNAKVEHIEGRGKVVDAHTVEVDGKTYTARNILIAVGNRANRLPIPGAEYAITSDDVLELPALPEKIAIIGGGYIGIEFAGMFHRFGTETHVVYRQSMPLGGFDDEVRKFVTEQYLATGLNLHPDMSPTEIRKEADGKLTVIIKSKDGKTEELKGNDQVLMATGRSPNTRNLGLEDAGVKLGKKGEVLVDEYSRTNVPSIWAVGDVTNRVQLTPVALMEGGALAKTIVLNEPTKPDYRAIPSAVFSHPEISTVGYTEAQALEAGHKDLDIYTTSFRPMRNNLSGSPLRVFIKLIVDANGRQILGAHMVGEHSSEIMQGIAVAVKVGVTKEQLDSVVGIHPTAAEELVTMRTVSRKVRAGNLVPA